MVIMVGVHVKDSRPGEPRRVPFGEGDRPVCGCISERWRQLDFHGPVLIEMWNDNRPDSMDLIGAARQWVVGKIQEGGLIDDAAL